LSGRIQPRKTAQQRLLPRKSPPKKTDSSLLLDLVLILNFTDCSTSAYEFMTCVLIENDPCTRFFPHRDAKARQLIEIDEHGIKAV
jgi:hypothetical protein